MGRSIGGRVLASSIATLVVTTGALAVLLPVVLGGYGESGTDPASIGRRVVAGMALAAVAGAVAGIAVSALVARSISGPVEDLTERAGRWGLAARGVSLERAPAEVARLAAALRRIAAEAERRQADAEAQRDRLATLLREMADAVVIVDAEDRVALANPSARRLLVSGDGGRLAEAVRDHEVLDVVARARRGGDAAAEIERIDPRRSIRLAATRLPRGDVVLTAQDLTTLRRLETVRRDFVANVSHELRTPLASIKAMVETLESGALRDPDAARDFVGRIHGQVDDLAQLVSELLALSRTESGEDAPRLADVAPADLMRGLRERMTSLAERASVDLTVAGLDGLPPVRADRDKIVQVLTNLVHNAVKFTPPGGRVEVAGARDGDAVRFSVRDTGIGLGRDELERVFERFYKGERSRSGGGTGLGLAIARHIVRAHGGEITADSAGPGHGSTFSFTLPAGRTGPQ